MAEDDVYAEEDLGLDDGVDINTVDISEGKDEAADEGDEGDEDEAEADAEEKDSESEGDGEGEAEALDEDDRARAAARQRAKKRLDAAAGDAARKAHAEIMRVPDEERVTSTRLHVMEAARVIAMRAAQIERHPVIFTAKEAPAGPPPEDSVAMAKKELLEGNCPLIIRREVGRSRSAKGLTIHVEEFRIRDMSLPPL